MIALLAFGLSLPARAQIPGWTEKAFGDDTQGSASVDANGVWTIKGQSGDLWERDDHFFIVYKQALGNIAPLLLNRPANPGFIPFIVFGLFVGHEFIFGIGEIAAGRYKEIPSKTAGIIYRHFKRF